MITAVGFPSQEPECSPEVRHDLPSGRPLPHSNDDWFRHVQNIDIEVPSESRLVMYDDPYSMASDRFRVLRMHLRALSKIRQVKVLMVTSAVPREGKTMTALNLAVGLSERGRSSVALVECDLRNPVLTTRLGIERRPGLIEFLRDGADPLSAVQFINPLGIYFLAAGEPIPNPIELLNSESFGKTIDRLRSTVDWVVLDAPPASPVPDVLALRGHADGCIWVVRAHQTSRELVRELIDQVGPDSVLAVLLNEAEDIKRADNRYYTDRRPLLLSAGH